MPCPPRRRPPPSDERQAALPLSDPRRPPTPEQIAKKAVAKRPTVPGRPDRVEVTLRFTLSRALMERLTARAIREGRSVEAVVAEILEAESSSSRRLPEHRDLREPAVSLGHQHDLLLMAAPFDEREHLIRAPLESRRPSRASG